MKVQLKFKELVKGGTEKTVIEINENTIAHLINDHALMKIIETESKIEKIKNKRYYLIGIEDIDED